MSTFDIAIIGAGPAGLIAAHRAAECGAKVIILEKNDRPGKKLLITGKGRCNITQGEDNMVKFIEPFGKKGRFLFSAFQKFGVDDVLKFFAGNGVPTNVERGNRVFPVSNRASDVLKALLKSIATPNISIRPNTAVRSIEKRTDDRFDLQTPHGTIEAKKVIICTGGLSYPSTGSSGDGYEWAKQFGHTLHQPEPALVGIDLTDTWISEVLALELEHVKICLYQHNKKKDERFGEVMFTHGGISGPIIIDISKTVGELIKEAPIILELDLKPALSHETLDNRLLRDLATFKLKQFRHVLTELLPKRMIPIIIELASLDPTKICSSITKEERKRLVNILKSLPLHVDKVGGFNKAIITAGGVSLKEIDPQTMQSKIIPNLYFAGEVIDLDGPTGGYNLQICWSTGYLAGESAAFSGQHLNK